MNRIYVLLLCLMAGVAGVDAQSGVRFVDALTGGHEIADGAEITIDEAKEDIFAGRILSSGLYVRNVGEADVLLAVQCVIDMPGGQHQICFPSSCTMQFSSQTYETPVGTMRAGTTQGLQAEWVPAAYGQCDVTYRIRLYRQTGTQPGVSHEYLGDGPSVTVHYVYADHDAPQAASRVYTYGEGGDYYYGMLNRVSDNGRWAVGADDGYQTGSYIIDTTAPETLIQVRGGELYDVTDDGVAVGAWYDNQGTATEPIYYAHAALYRDGAWTRLPEPAKCSGRSFARIVSPDGRHIGGMAYCPAKDSEVGGKYYPCLWTRGDDGSYRVTAYNDMTLPGNMGFYVYDMSDDGRVLVGCVCTDAGGRVPAMVQDGQLVCWNKMEWKEKAYEINGETAYYETGFVDGVMEGATDKGWFNGCFNYLSGDYAYGHRTVATDVDAEKGTGRLTHYRTVYNIRTGEFSDEPGESYYTCGYDERSMFLVSGVAGYFKRDGMMRRLGRAFDLPGTTDIAAVYSCDAAGRVFACSMVWLNEAIGEYCESPVLMILDRPLSDAAAYQPASPTATGRPLSVTLSPSNAEPLPSLSGVGSIRFAATGGVRIADDMMTVGDGTRQYRLTMGDAANELLYEVAPAITESGEYTFTIPEGALINDDTDEWLPETSFTYTVDAALAGDGGWTVSPALDQPVPQLEGTYTITLTNYKRVRWDSTVRPCRVFIYRKGADLSMRPLAWYDATVNKNTITFTAKPGVYEAGSYFINLTEFVNGTTGAEIEDINIPFTLTGGTPPEEPEEKKPVLDESYVLTPDNHAPLTELSGRIVITFPGVRSFADIGGFPTITTPSGERHGVFADGTVVRIKSYAQLDGGDYISNAGYIDLDAAGLRFTEPGVYTISIPKTVFHVDGDYDKDYADPFEFTYTVGSPAAVLLDENFDGDYTENFPRSYDGDGLETNAAISALFLSSEHERSMPWWVLRESSGDTDRFMGSHSYYSTAGQSDDWFVSRTVTIPTEGYRLEFDAQSVAVRGDVRLSDLAVCVSERVVTDFWRPSDVTRVYENVPCGDSPSVTTGEWAHYTMPMDEWAGKTVQICFVNRNKDRDLLCLDNVRVCRHEAVSVELAPMPEYTADETLEVAATVTAVDDDLAGYEVQFVCRGVTVAANEAAETIRKGESRTFTATVTLEPCVTATVAFRLTEADGASTVRTGCTTRLAFRTTHRVLVEETTGLWCGNCPIGIYTMESIKEDAGLADCVLPVSIHISGTTPDMMAVDAYADYLGLSGVAPMTRIDRGADAVGFSAAHDAAYDPDNESSFAYRVAWQQRQPALMDIDVEVEPVLDDLGGDTIAVQAVAHVRPAVALDAQRYRVGFILTENNVGLDNSPYWVQHNYFAGYPFASQLGGWTELPEEVQNVRYHYVARAVPWASGKEGSFSELNVGGEYAVEARIDVPDAYMMDSRGRVTSPAVRPSMCEVTAYVVDTHDLSVQNSARVAVTPQALELFRVGDLLNGVASLAAGGKSSDTIYDMQGRALGGVSRPGVYIIGNRKVVVR